VVTYESRRRVAFGGAKNGARSEDCKLEESKDGDWEYITPQAGSENGNSG